MISSGTETHNLSPGSSGEINPTTSLNGEVSGSYYRYFGKYCNNLLTTLQYCKQYIINYYNARSYHKALYEYNLRHVLELELKDGEKEKRGVVNLLGKGTNGRVERLEASIDSGSQADRPCAQMIAYKTAKKSKDCLLKKEMKALSDLDHPNIIRPVAPNGVGLSAKYKTTFLVTKDSTFSDFDIIDLTEEAGGIPLPLADLTLFHEIKNGCLSAHEKDGCIRALFSAVKYMHDSGYVHLDIHASNVLKKGDQWLLTDFGSAVHDNQLFGNLPILKLDRTFKRLFNGVDHQQLPLVTVIEASIFRIKTDYYALSAFGCRSPQIHARYNHFLGEHSIAPDEKQKREDLFRSMELEFENDKNLHVQTDGRSVDAYSLGILTFQILTGNKPFTDTLAYNDVDTYSLPQKYQEEVNQVLKQHKTTLRQYYEIIEGLLKSDIKERMTVSAALEKLRNCP